MIETRYSRLRIERIIERGTVQEKARLFLRDRAGYFVDGCDFILKFGEPERLMNSVDPSDLTEWNRQISLGLRIENAFKDLHRFLLARNRIRNEYNTAIRCLIEFENLEGIVNRLLTLVRQGSGTAADESLNQAIGVYFSTMTRPEIDSNGDFNLQIDTEQGRRTVRTWVAEVKKELIEQTEWYLDLEFALKKRIKEFKLNVPEYNLTLLKYRSILETPITKIGRFMGVQNNRHILTGIEKNDVDLAPLPAIKGMTEDLTVNVAQIRLNEEKINNYYDKI